MHHEVPAVGAPIRLPIDVCNIEILLSLRQACDVVAGISKRGSHFAIGEGDRGLEVPRPVSHGAAMTADFGSAMIALGAEPIRGCRSPKITLSGSPLTSNSALR